MKRVGACVSVKHVRKLQSAIQCILALVMEKNVGLIEALGVYLLPGVSHRQFFEAEFFFGWLWQSENKLCIALRLDGVLLTSDWLQLVGLLLSANEATRDDGLFIEQQKAWLIRNYSDKLNHQEIAEKFEMQMAIAHILIDAQ